MRNLKSIDWVLLSLIILLLLFGLVVIFSITFHTSKQNLASSQLIYAILGLGLLVLFTAIDYRTLSSASIVLYIIGIALLVLVLVLGRSKLGSTRWIELGFFNFQPSEIFKVILILTLSNFLAKKEDILVFDFLFYLGLIALPAALVLLEPDLGTAFIYVIIGLALFIACRSKEIYLLITGLIGAILLPIFWFFILKFYQRERILTFIDPSHDPFGSGYNVLQSTISVGSGGLLGRGLGHGPQSQLNFLPIAHTDFIFASLAEELGFIGAGLLLILFLILIMRIVSIAVSAKDALGRYLAFGVAAMILFQVLINVGMNIGLMPVTGIPLPLISHGGSSLFSTMIALGIVCSIFIRRKSITFS
ncbi:rod shape-determining protein RodA [Patescibacteria group bacterium]|nr:rod shape-determining protein RodA [Patescibacteria group bacterium]